MPIPRPLRVLLFLAGLVCVVAIAAAVFVYRSHYKGPETNPIPDLIGQLPAGAPAIAYIDVAALRQLKGSPLASLLGLATSDANEDREYQEFVRSTGFDYARDLDRAALAIWPPKTESPPHAQENAQENEILAIADGRFDQQKIQAYALRSGTTVTRGKHSLYQVPGDPPVSFGFLSATRVILASGPNAETHILGAESLGLDPPIRALVDHVSGASFFVAARADALPKSIYTSIGQSSQIANMAMRIQGLTLAGRPNADNLDLALDAQCDSTKSALEISTLLGGLRIFGPLALSDPKTKSQMTKEQAKFLATLLAQVQIRQQENWVRITWEVTPQMLTTAQKH
jgi:hypothetical protein